MSPIRIAAILCCAAGLGMASAGHAARADDEAAIRAVEAGQATAWNAHDAGAYARLFSDDADVVNVLGWWWKSRAELEQKLGRAFATVFAHSVLRVEDVSLRFLSDDLAVAHVRWSMTGAISPDGSGRNVPQQGIQTQLLKKTAGHWLISEFQNTNSVPEKPFARPSG
jgi:uncharacterized protein (TIGR02246 family)